MPTPSQQTPLKLVSAMKGGRQKEGITPLEKLTVKWDPDVYDPPATSLSHTVKSHNQQQRSSSRSNNKKHGKHKHKGKSSRGNNSNDKKQYRKYTCNSDSLCSISQVTSDRLQHLDGFEQSSVEDFGVTGQDASNCSSSFLKTSLTKMHISVAEAT
ncbi:hypothetical protein BVC80_1835g737 [Macleaya cordata]|uniref:Uncharacterized protein n=1 Tax=Macleaya cordata TaxID=56857 RepID=A0A200R6E8_MACCD|nr:hypothetical protein BVC80_1835g737 [Macleaya cordata]